MGKNIWLQLRDSVLAVDDDWLQAFLFGQLAHIWPQAGERLYWSDALKALARVGDENEWTVLLVRFAPLLPPSLYDAAFNLIERVKWRRNRTRLLLAYAPFLPAERKERVMTELLETLVNLEAGPETADQLDKLLPYLSDAQRMAAVKAIEEEPDLWNQAQKLRPFLPYLRTIERQTVVSQIIFRCRRLEAGDRFRVMAEVAQYLPEPKLRELVDGFRTLDDDTSRLAVLERVVEALPEAQMAWVWDGIQSVWNKNRRSWLMCRLYHWLPTNRQPAALSEIRNTLQITAERDGLLLAIRDDVPSVLLFEMLEMAAETKEPPQLELLDGLLARLPAGMLADGLEIALNAARSDLRHRRLEMLNRLAGRLVDWAEEMPENARDTWQWLFSRRKRLVDVGVDDGGELTEIVTEAAVSRTEFLVDMMGLLPFFLHFVPDNHKPLVAVQLIDEMRQRLTGPKLMRHGFQMAELPQPAGV